MELEQEKEKENEKEEDEEEREAKEREEREERERRREERESLLTPSEKKLGHRKRDRILISTLKTPIGWFLVIVSSLLGGLFFYLIEQDDQELYYLDAVYWAVVTCSTVGYGDVTPSSKGGRAFTCFYALIAIPFFGFAVGFLLESISGLSEVFAVSLFGKGNEIASWRKFARNNFLLMLSGTLFILIWILGALAFKYLEGWSMSTAMYFCFITQSTVGYGDITPTSNRGRIFAMFYIVLSTGNLGVIIGALIEKFQEKRHNLKKSVRKKIEVSRGILLPPLSYEEEENLRKYVDGLSPEEVAFLHHYLPEHKHLRVEEGEEEREEEEEEA